jgi:glycosyltransferase involved in cell wall biosynthesis
VSTPSLQPDAGYRRHQVSAERPVVAVVVPFRGDEPAAHRLIASLDRLELRPDDELVVADNTADGVALDALAAAGISAVHANREASSYHARNAGSARTAAPWILFMDCDCTPNPALLDAYFAEPVAERCAVLAGEITGSAAGDGFVARYSRSRNLFSQSGGLHARSGRTAATGNLMVRRTAFEEIGGFAEGIRSGGDVDLCLRFHDAGWGLEYRPGAAVGHPHRSDLRSLLEANARYGAGARWLDERHGNVTTRWPLIPGLQGSLRDAATRTLAGEREEAAFRLLDGVGLIAHTLGYRGSNRAAKLDGFSAAERK